MKLRIALSVLALCAATSVQAGKGPTTNQSLSSGNEIVSRALKRAHNNPNFLNGSVILVPPGQYQQIKQVPGVVHNPVAGTITVEVTLRDGSKRTLVFSQQGGRPLRG